MEMELGFGPITQKIDVPDERLLGVLTPNDVAHVLTGEAEVRRALESPIGTPMLREIVKPGEKIAILTSDVTRPMPTYVVMPALLNELYTAGVQKEDVTLVFCLGSHRKQTETERRKLAGDLAFLEIACVDGDLTDFVHFGVTSRGTPVDIVRPVAEADRRICLGNIEYHYFAGYSGGAKAVMPGASTRQAIQCNHCHMTEEGSCAGNLSGNPVREDIEEAANMVGVDFILNVVLDEHKKIIHAVAGDVTKAHREGCAFLDRLFAVPIGKRADIVVVSQGGAPKDINLYQTQKALDNAKHAVRDGGVIVLVGACQEGLGEKVFEEWMTTAETSESMIRRIRQDFQLGGHKAAAIAMVLQKADIYLVSLMDPALVESIFLKPYSTAQEALKSAEQKLGKDATVLVMPYGGSTLPRP
ncbi:MAG: nickel-dependent lactate racemase, partial [Clostridia bacterium]|nr:nickel-dependent lactate racemase [Clostridia bacterium]